MASEEVLYVEGGQALRGEVVVQGSKNAALPMIAASLLATEGQTVLHRVPPVKDVLVALQVLRELGARVEYDMERGVAVIDASGGHIAQAPRRPFFALSRFRAFCRTLTEPLPSRLDTRSGRVLSDRAPLITTIAGLQDSEPRCRASRGEDLTS